jgi:hypothetical protein
MNRFISNNSEWLDDYHLRVLVIAILVPLCLIHLHPDPHTSCNTNKGKSLNFVKQKNFVCLRQPVLLLITHFHYRTYARVSASYLVYTCPPISVLHNNEKIYARLRQPKYCLSLSSPISACPTSCCHACVSPRFAVPTMSKSGIIL